MTYKEELYQQNTSNPLDNRDNLSREKYKSKNLNKIFTEMLDTVSGGKKIKVYSAWEYFILTQRQFTLIVNKVIEEEKIEQHWTTKINKYDIDWITIASFLIDNPKIFDKYDYIRKKTKANKLLNDILYYFSI